MIVKHQTLIVTALAVLAIYAFVALRGQQPAELPDIATEAEPCGSCDARHKNLSRIKDARDLNAGGNE